MGARRVLMALLRRRVVAPLRQTAGALTILVLVAALGLSMQSSGISSPGSCIMIHNGLDHLVLVSVTEPGGHGGSFPINAGGITYLQVNEAPIASPTGDFAIDISGQDILVWDDADKKASPPTYHARTTASSGRVAWTYRADLKADGKCPGGAWLGTIHAGAAVPPPPAGSPAAATSGGIYFPRIISSAGQIAGVVLPPSEIPKGDYSQVSVWAGKGKPIFVRSTTGTITTFDVPEGMRGANVLSVSDTGRVLFSDGYHHYLHNAAGTVTTFDLPGFLPFRVGLGWVGFGFDDSGRIAGQICKTEQCRDRDMKLSSQGFLRSATGAVTTFGVPGAEYTSPTGMNNAGQIVGTFVSYADFIHTHGFLRSATGAFTIFDVPDFTLTYPECITNTGQIIGSAIVASPKHDWVSRLFRRSVSGTISTSPLPNEGENVVVRSCSAAGQVVGVVGSPRHDRIFVISPTGVITTFGIPGATDVEAWGISDAGLVVGVYADASRNWRPFLRARTGMITVDNLF